MAKSDPSDTVVDEVPARALKFLGAASHNASVFGMLGARGYSEEVHEHGWQLLFAASGYKKPRPQVVDTPVGRAALEEIDAWDEPNFAIAHAALDGEFPDQSDYVFADLTAEVGAGSIVSVATFLDRRDALKAGRAGTKKEDQAAVKKLTDRGITDAVCTHLRDLLKKASAAPSLPAPVAPAPDADPTAAKAAKLALYKWYSEWAQIAHALIKRRDYLVQLGLATRKVKATTKTKAKTKTPDPNDASSSSAQGGEKK